MTRIFFFSFVFALALALVLAQSDDGIVVRTCGKSLYNRVFSLCGDYCSAKSEGISLTHACRFGLSDNQLVQLCCPSKI
ncbi:Protein CBG26602 [Caenorhabditis briggsae]|uniref:Uncharacterized protein n=2 Tax=Caenorhabditis briggsae TaxID=6238 RepID=A0AAE9J5N0_CAEBR|nr:Protein CBG26602 [Caenorhabditis briggsae]ULU13793.1 hypothetical protein L3Y34_016353 [Caenorhabditis briggsae]UMM14721.1 hypothetical protein L5515_002418 [Caenorhabditis briggsae]CAS00582.1 Protein CBG26602 [Caenorhabditis briggsae]